MANFKARGASEFKTPEERRIAFLREFRKTGKAAEARESVGLSQSWYEQQRRSTEGFAAEVDSIRDKIRRGENPFDRREAAGDFKHFSEKYLKTPVFPHIQDIVDVIEGKDPSWKPPGIMWEKGLSGHTRLIVNLPPNFAKSMSITIGYSVYEICKNPDTSIIVVSKTQALARKMLSAIRSRLTHPEYAELQRVFGGIDGFKAGAENWGADRIQLGSELRGPQEKDPTVEALGFGSQIYGARAKLIILDDVVTLSNAADYEKQMDWIRQEVATRLGPGGVLLVLGTRVAPLDLYRELRNPDHYTDGESPWSYLGLPAVLDYGDGSPETWESLWPRSHVPFSEADLEDDDGLYPRWTGERLARLRNEVGPSKWAMVYQQLDVSEDAVFNPLAIRGSINGMRKPGPLRKDAAGHPANQDAIQVICAMDPAMSKDTATVAYAVDRRTGKRYVLDMDVMRAPSTVRIQERIKSWTDLYQPKVWVIEKNANQLYILQDPVIVDYLRTRGVALKGHYTSGVKIDPDFGVPSMAPLFGQVVSKDQNRGHKFEPDSNMIELPDTTTAGPKMLVEQLLSWQPHKKAKNLAQDTVMALWFAELEARRMITTASTSDFEQFFESQFTSARDREDTFTISFDELGDSNFTF